MALRLALLLVCAPLVSTSVGESLERWLVSRGALLGGEVRTPAGKPRGVYATRDYADDETLGFLPFSVAVPVGKSGEYSVPALARRAYDASSLYFVNGTYAPFWASQPPLSEMLCVDTMGQAEAEALEVPELADHVRLTRQSHREQYENFQAELAFEARAPPPKAGDPPRLLSFDQYLHLAAVITTRAFAFHDEQGECCGVHLLPGFDLLNCESAYNAKRRHSLDGEEGGAWRIEAKANREVKAGEELVWDYFHTPTPRIDLQLLQYGYLNETDTRLLAADLPGWNPHNPLAELGQGEDTPASALSLQEAQEELARLERISAPLAPLKADQAALAAAADPWSPSSMVLRLRVRRKIALAARAAEMRKRLGKAEL